MSGKTTKSNAPRRRAPAVLVAIATLLGIAGATATANASDGRTKITGRVQATIEMLNNGQMKTSELALVTANGKRYPVRSSALANQLADHAGEQVAITGRIANNALAVDEFHRVATYQAPAGAKRAAVIRTRPYGRPTSGAGPAALRSLVFDGSNSLANMWKKESHGKLTLTGDVFSEELPPNTPSGCGSTGAAPTLAARHPGYDFYLFLATSLGCGGTLGMARMPGSYSWYFGGLRSSTLWHETGHNLGFHHSNQLVCTEGGVRVPISQSCVSKEYWDWYTAMGNGGGACGYDAYQEIIADWDMPFSQVSADATVQVRARNINSGGLPKAILVPGAPAEFGGYYMLEWHTSDYPSCTSKTVTGLQIRVVGDAAPGLHTHLIDMTPTNGAGDEALHLGATFRDPMTNISITLVSEDLGNGVANVQIKFNDGPPLPPPDATASVVGGQLKVVGNDSDATGDNIDVHDAGSDAIVTDTAFPMTAGAGCVNVDPNSVRCTGFTKIALDGRSGTDRFTVQSAWPVLVDDAVGKTTIKTGATPDGPLTVGAEGNYVVDYSTRTTPLTVSFDGNANDGAAGENDNVGTGGIVGGEAIGGSANDTLIGSSTAFSRLTGGPGNDTLQSRYLWTILYGGPGDDTLLGSSAPEFFFGDDGNDTITPGLGVDYVLGGSGNDVINTKDGVVDQQTDCGLGTDTLVADAPNGSFVGDTSTGCENVSF